jgi:threonine aldolase
MIRLVCSFATAAADVDHFLATVKMAASLSIRSAGA